MYKQPHELVPGDVIFGKLIVKRVEAEACSSRDVHVRVGESTLCIKRGIPVYVWANTEVREVKA